jgi:hypothetical protein
MPSTRDIGQRTPHEGGAPSSDGSTCVKSWGRFGAYWGALFGFTLGAILVTVRLSTDILTIGVVRTVMVAVIECAVIAGGFAALAAALFDLRGAPSKPILRAEPEVAATDIQNGAAPVAEWPDHAAYPVQTSVPPVLLIPDNDWDSAPSLLNIQASLNTIDAWENGNTGP